MDKRVKFVVCAAGIFVCYFFYGILQEKITRGTYGTDGEKFTHTLSLVFVQCVVNYAFAKVILQAFPEDSDTTSSTYYLISSLTYLIAMVFSNMALQWVDYPTQVVAKSGKPIPVMILGVILGRKSYPLKKYLFVLLVVIGVALFMFKDGKSKTSRSESILGLGEILLILSLTMDGVTGAIQERMRSESKTKSTHMMINMNLWSMLFLGIALIVTGQIFEFIGFVQRYPQLIVHLMMFSIFSALGQFFIFWTVSDFGPLPCSIVTTTRKFFTVLASVLLFGNPMLTRQWIATIVVFTGLFLDSFYGKQTVKTK
ncbi:solute carrier family 35 member B1 [Daktulosphaira vitifoliae]|uniref:solute carrier family 35 member B1 n=1 Tax=Daktulosphaira vitifoliae TaxID=58002 RepID=UPI0021AAA782|nr:solute carrier family 35 member B1 [Daktulosphaira vitifoliae]